MSYEHELDAREIFDLLIEGKKLEVTFSSQKKAEAFRIRLHQIKSNSEKQYIELGMMDRDEVQSILFEKVSVADVENGFIFRISLGKRKRETIRFPVKIIYPIAHPQYE